MQKKKEEQKKLLEYLAEEAGCQDLSELSTGFWLPVACFIAGTVKPDQYSLKEWNHAVRYLTGKKIRFCTPKQAQEYLMKNKDNFYTDTKAIKL